MVQPGLLFRNAMLNLFSYFLLCLSLLFDITLSDVELPVRNQKKITTQQSLLDVYSNHRR